MSNKSRFITSVLLTAKEDIPEMPWAARRYTRGKSNGMTQIVPFGEAAGEGVA